MKVDSTCGGVSRPSGPMVRPASAIHRRTTNAPMRAAGSAPTMRNGSPTTVARWWWPCASKGRLRCPPTQVMPATTPSAIAAPASARPDTATPVSTISIGHGNPMWFAGAPTAVSTRNPTISPARRPSSPATTTRPVATRKCGTCRRSGARCTTDATWTTPSLSFPAPAHDQSRRVQARGAEWPDQPGPDGSAISRSAWRPRPAPRPRARTARR